MASNKTILLLFFIVTLIHTGSSTVCYECNDCNQITEETHTCEAKYCWKMDMGKWSRGCDETDQYCVPHAGMGHTCVVCNEDYCNVGVSLNAGTYCLLFSIILVAFRNIY